MHPLLKRQLKCLVLVALVAFALTSAPAARASSIDDLLPRPAPASATVTVAVLNVRSGPGTGFAILDHVSAGMTLTVLGQDDNGDWLQVQAPGGHTGWVSARFVSTSAAAVVADPNLPVRIVAPAIGLDARVLPAGWHAVRNTDGSLGSDWDVPSYAAGWLITSARPGTAGNAVLAGHHNIEGEVFRYVVNLSAGDVIMLYTGERTLTYRVTDRFILPDKYVSYEQRLQNARWIGAFDDERLTLVTCWPYTNNTHRVIVVAKPEPRS